MYSKEVTCSNHERFFMQANAVKIEHLKTSSDVTIEQNCCLYLDFN